MHVGKRLKKLMQEKRIQTDTMAARVGVSPGAVSNWFATGHIARDNLVPAADAIGESVRFLLTGDPRDRVLSVLEAEFAQRDVPEGTLQAILTLIRACPERVEDPADRPVTLADDGDADAAAFRRALEPPSSASRQPRPAKKRH